MWHQKKEPCLIFEGEESFEVVVSALLEGGYQRCQPFLTSLPRDAEVAAFRRDYGHDRQVHVQIVLLSSGGSDDLAFGYEDDAPALFGLYAHSEPSVRRPIKHLLSAFRDKMCYRSGARVVKRDLAKLLEDVSPVADATGTMID